MGYKYKKFLRGKTVYSCRNCGAHLTTKDFLISTEYQGRYGRAHLFKAVVNSTEGKRQERAMTTGFHIVCDVSCEQCSTYIGWKYIFAYKTDQKFKEGKYILEKQLIKGTRAV